MLNVQLYTSLRWETSPLVLGLQDDCVNCHSPTQAQNTCVPVVQAVITHEQTVLPEGGKVNQTAVVPRHNTY